MRENRTYGSEGGEGESSSLPLSAAGSSGFLFSLGLSTSPCFRHHQWAAHRPIFERDHRHLPFSTNQRICKRQCRDAIARKHLKCVLSGRISIFCQAWAIEIRTVADVNCTGWREEMRTHESICIWIHGCAPYGIHGARHQAVSMKQGKSSYGLGETETANGCALGSRSS